MEYKLMELLKDFQLLDLIGFATLLKVKEQDEFEDYIVDIVAAFSQLNRKDRKKYLKLAKQIRDNNKEFDKIKNTQ